VPNGSTGGNRKKQLLPNRLVEDRELEAPTRPHSGKLCTSTDAGTEGSSRTKNRCHLVGHLRVPKARGSILSRNRRKHYITARDLQASQVFNTLTEVFIVPW